MASRGNRGTRARDADRNVTLDVLSNGYADGQLDRAEYDSRVERALSATYLPELSVLTRDLQGAPTALPSQAAPPRPVFRPPTSLGSHEKRQLAKGVAAVVAVLAVMVVVPKLFGSDEEETIVAAEPQGEQVDLFADGAYEQLVAELDDSLDGGPVVFSATVREDGASFQVPLDQSSQRYHDVSYGPDGWEETDRVGTSTEGRLDLLRIDPDDVAAGLREVEEMVADVERDKTAVNFSAPDHHFDDRTCFTVSAGNRFSEYASIRYTCNGSEISRTEP